jgi:hypothetical protein
MRKKHLKSPSGRRGKIGRRVFHIANMYILKSSIIHFFRYEIIQKNFREGSRGGERGSAFSISSDQ